MTKIYLSPSSQENNRGALSGYVEEVVCNRIADAAEIALRRQGGFEIKRNNPANTYAQHTAESNAWKADIHVAIHTNAANGKTRGLNAGCYNPNNAGLLSTRLTKALFDVLSQLTPAADKMVQYSFMEVTKTNAPCAYLEISFHDNPEDCVWILGNITQIGEGIARGIMNFLNRTFVGPVDDATPVVTASPTTQNSTEFQQVTLCNTSADGSGKPVKVYGTRMHMVKRASGKYPYGMNYTGGDWVDAWFPEGSFE